jgi:acyl carrier protein
LGGAEDVIPSVEEIQQWLVDRVSTLTGLAPKNIAPKEHLSRFGLDSVMMITLAADLENWLGYRFRDNPFEDHPTIEELSQFLAAQIAKRPISESL